MASCVAIIGLGRIGTPMAGHLQRAGVLAAVYDPHPARLGPFRSVAASTPAAAASAAEIVLIPLATGVHDPIVDATEPPSSRYVERVLLGPDGVLAGARPGTLIVDMTTGDPQRTRRLAPRVQAAGCELMDAPISGAESRARDATLSIMAAGSREAFQRALPVLQLLGSEICHVGPLGTGHTLKLLHNLVACIIVAALAEVAVLAERAGIDRTTFMAAINAGVAASHMSRVKGPRIVERSYADSVDQIFYQAEVVRLALGLARELGHSPRLAAETNRLMQLAGQLGLGTADTAALIEVTGRREQS